MSIFMKFHPIATCLTFSLVCTPLIANDLTDAVASGALWQKDRDTICSTDFVGIRYAPIDNYSVRLLPRLEITQAEGEVTRTLLKKSRLTINTLEFGETLVQWDEQMNTHNMEAWIYNRGDDGDISQAMFNNILFNAIVELSKMTGDEEHVIAFRGMGDVNHVAVTGVNDWTWVWDNGAMLLEASASELPDGSVRPEFIRLKMGANVQAIATGDGDNIAPKKVLKNNVVRNRNTNDVCIPSVQMVDQGTKGYCLPATVARVFAYYGMDAVDQHALAQLFKTDAQQGTYESMMYAGLTGISKKFNFRLVSHPCVGSNQTNNDWLPIIRRSIDDGIPLIWGVQLGIVKEAGIPNGYGEDSGHMRLIIGYNNHSKEILYTDSWGAGHELKRMSVRDAAKISFSLYTLVPTK